MSALASLMMGAGACGRSDLFSKHHRNGSGTGGDISEVDGGAGEGGSVGHGGTSGSVGGSIGDRGGNGGSIGGRGGATGTAGRGGTTGVAGRGGTTGVAGRGGTTGVAGRGGTTGTAGRGGSTGRGGTGGTGNSCASRAEICNNGVDDNCNNLADCQDPSCFGDTRCAPPGMEICNNNLDDDDDGRIDCADPDCMNSLACKPTMGMEICNNGVDDNRDNLVDCADPQCTTFPGCLATACTVDIDFGTIAAHGAAVKKVMDTTGATVGYSTCAPAGGVGRVGRFQLDATADVRVDFSQGPTSAHAIGLFRAGASQRCDRNPVDTCIPAMDMPNANKTFAALPPGVYYVIVESYPRLTGSTVVALSTGSISSPEICANGKDDDGNGLTDCQDAVCKNDPSCVGSQCNPDVNIGTLVVDGDAHAVSANLATSDDTYQSTCSAGKAGGDIAIAFTLAETAGLEVEFMQTGRSIFAIYNMPGPGLACDANQRSCSFQDESANAIAWVTLPAGRYVFVAKAQEGRAGNINLRFSAFSGRRVEICGNGIDDDANGLTDCDDPACFGVAGCPAPACMPDQDLGSFSWNTRRTVTVDTRGGTTLYPTSCSRGNGKERVLRVNLTQPMSLSHDCMDGGSHVLALAQQLQPLDACDEHEVVCVDPSVLPFGCGYSIPELQPGNYNVIIQAFQAGSEGTVTLTLTGIQEQIREICDNGIDDDRDGATDCDDKKCVTEAICAKFACRADATAKLLPLDGTAVLVSVTTTGNMNDQQKMCSTASGDDAVVDFQLPALADVTMQWAQVGNHNFALYDNKNPNLACDAGTQFACVMSSGTPSGSYVFTKLPGGRYHLVVDAAAPGKEGGAVLQFSAIASPMP
ncbi:MAG TPA: hypothetical protein VN903_25555 [Polyangia bacterium]|nr:hypothetical protein [Polyangia bacterium]